MPGSSTLHAWAVRYPFCSIDSFTLFEASVIDPIRLSDPCPLNSPKHAHTHTHTHASLKQTCHAISYITVQEASGAPFSSPHRPSAPITRTASQFPPFQEMSYEQLWTSGQHQRGATLPSSADRPRCRLRDKLIDADREQATTGREQ